MITLFTFGGALSPTDGTACETCEHLYPNIAASARSVGGGFENNVAYRLRDENPNNWSIYPLVYSRGLELPLKENAVGRAIATFGSALQKVSGPIGLIGLSQGAWITDIVLEEFTNPQGLFHSRLTDLKCAVTFGSPRRPFGFTTDLPGTINPAGQGIANFPHELSFGSVPGLLADPPEFYRAYCMINDAASDSPTDSTIASAAGAVAEFVWDGDISSTIGLATQLGTILADFAGAVADIFLPGDGDGALTKWFPFLGGALGGDARINNPHARYNSFAYDAILDAPIISGLQYVNDWNVVTNNPALSDATGGQGQVYKVTTGGVRNLGSGNITWAVNDYAVHNNGVWTKATRNLTGGTACWSTDQSSNPLGTYLPSLGGRTAVDLAVDFLKPFGAEYADVTPAEPLPKLGYTWWQTPPD